MSALQVARSCEGCEMNGAVVVRGVCQFAVLEHRKAARVCPTHLAVYEAKGALCSECHDRGFRSSVRYEVLAVQP